MLPCKYVKENYVPLPPLEALIAHFTLKYRDVSFHTVSTSLLYAYMAAFQNVFIFTVICGPPKDKKSNFLNICSQDQSSLRLFWCLQLLRGLEFMLRGVFIIYIIQMKTYLFSLCFLKCPTFLSRHVNPFH